MINKVVIVLSVLLLVTGCSTLISEKGNQRLDISNRYAVVPLINLSETPQAGDQAASIVTAILRAEGVKDVTLYLPEDDNPLMYESQARQAEAVTSARAEGMETFVAGTVEEWRYKAGFDSEPAVGVTLMVIDTKGQILWSGTAARTGWSREAVGTVAREVLQDLVQAMPLVSLEQ